MVSNLSLKSSFRSFSSDYVILFPLFSLLLLLLWLFAFYKSLLSLLELILFIFSFNFWISYSIFFKFSCISFMWLVLDCNYLFRFWAISLILYPFPSLLFLLFSDLSLLFLRLLISSRSRLNSLFMKLMSFVFPWVLYSFF